LGRANSAFLRKPSANPQRIILVVVLLIVIETSQVEHEGEDNDDDPAGGFAEGLPMSGDRLLCNYLSL
jgi:hypothetical protein